MNCPYCGNPSLEGAAFCGNCGAKLETGSAAPAASAPLEQNVPLAAPEPVSAFDSPEPAPLPPPEPAPASFAPPVQPAYTPSYAAPAPAPKKKGNRTLLIVVVVLVLLMCCCCAVFFGVLSLIPWDSNTFRELQLYLGTPTPSRIR